MPSKKVVCPECGKKLVNVYEHMKYVHKLPYRKPPNGSPPQPQPAVHLTGPIKPIPSQMGADGLYHCPECDEGFPFKQPLVQHRVKAHKISMYKQYNKNPNRKGKEQTNGISSTTETSQHHEQEATARQVAYLLGRIESLISAHAESTGASSAQLTEGVAELLRRKARR